MIVIRPPFRKRLLLLASVAGAIAFALPCHAESFRTRIYWDTKDREIPAPAWAKSCWQPGPSEQEVYQSAIEARSNGTLDLRLIHELEDEASRRPLDQSAQAKLGYALYLGYLMFLPTDALIYKYVYNIPHTQHLQKAYAKSVFICLSTSEMPRSADYWVRQLGERLLAENVDNFDIKYSMAHLMTKVDVKSFDRQQVAIVRDLVARYPNNPHSWATMFYVYMNPSISGHDKKQGDANVERALLAMISLQKRGLLPQTYRIGSR